MKKLTILIAVFCAATLFAGNLERKNSSHSRFSISSDGQFEEVTSLHERAKFRRHDKQKIKSNKRNIGKEIAFAAPGNDMFANRITISGANGSVTGSNVDASLETGEPQPASTGTSMVDMDSACIRRD